MSQQGIQQRRVVQLAPTVADRLGGSTAGLTSEGLRRLRAEREVAARRRRERAEEASSKALRKVSEAGHAAALARLQSRHLASLKRSAVPSGEAAQDERGDPQLRLARLAAVRARAAAYRSARAADQAIADALRSCGAGDGEAEPSITDLVEQLSAASSSRPLPLPARPARRRATRR